MDNDIATRRRSLVGKLGALSRNHTAAVAAAEHASAERPAWRPETEHRELCVALRAIARGIERRAHATRAELVALTAGDGRCHARCRDGHACRAPAVKGRRRCKLHGGLSTGPRTPEGKVRALAALASARARSSMSADVPDAA